jgi:hypothetical protein
MKHAINILFLVTAVVADAAVTLHVSPAGNDANPGTSNKPLATLAAAQAQARQSVGREAVTVLLHAGTYHLPDALRFTAQDSGTKEFPVSYEAAPGEAPVISGAKLLQLKWSPGNGGVWSAPVPNGLVFDQLCADGTKMIRARYPNFNPADVHFGGVSRDATDPARLSRYADPVGLFIHGYHNRGWGSQHYEIVEKAPDGRYRLDGKDTRVSTTYREPPSADQLLVENVWEELDAPGEWFLDRRSSVLYFIPPKGANPQSMVFEAVVLRHLIEIRGTQAAPVRYLTLRGLSFRAAAMTFMEATFMPSGGDWSIYRGGAVVIQGAEDCAVRDSNFDNLGGNAIFVLDYNRRIEVTGCEFTNLGASAVLFDGDLAAVRSQAHIHAPPARQFGPRAVGPYVPPAAKPTVPPARPALDLTPGPRNENYPADCIVRDCLMHDLGTVEKQVSGVFISKARNILVSHLSIYDVPRAAININDGMWGGHTVEWCDLFNSCRESREHGTINSWGRDRYRIRPQPKQKTTAEDNAFMREHAKLDTLDPITLRYNRVQCDVGYDIDLDDGSSNYIIENNLCLQGGIKLREGFFRTVRNNITPLISPHVWYPNSGDIITKNILTGEKPYSPRGMKMEDAKSEQIDRNLFATFKVPETFRRLGIDRNSVTADPQFVNAAAADYRVRPGSPAVRIGFVNFPMDQFGVASPHLKSRAKKWDGLGGPMKGSVGEPADTALYTWQGATLRSLINFGRESEILGAREWSDNRGVLIKAVAADSVAARAKLPADAAILAVNGRPVSNIIELIKVLRESGAEPVRLKVFATTGYAEIEMPAAAQLPARATK